MKPRERTLLAVFCTLLVLLTGGGLLSLTMRSWRDVRTENEQLRMRLQSLRSTIAQGTEWGQRSEWIHSNIPAFTSAEEASARLLETIVQQAADAGVKLDVREFVQPSTNDVDSAQATIFSQARVRVTLKEAQEEQLFRWLHTVAQPELFVGITRLQITPSGNKVDCEAEFTQFFREAEPVGLTSAAGATVPY